MDVDSEINVGACRFSDDTVLLVKLLWWVDVTGVVKFGGCLGLLVGLLQMLV